MEGRSSILDRGTVLLSFTPAVFPTQPHIQWVSQSPALPSHLLLVPKSIIYRAALTLSLTLTLTWYLSFETIVLKLPQIEDECLNV